MKRSLLFLFLFFYTVSLWAAGSQEDVKEKKLRPVVFAANYPLYYLCQRYAEDSIELLWPFSDDEDPAFWEPLDEQIRELQRADLLILNGAGYEKWLEYSFIDPNLTVDSSAAFKERYIETEAGTSHSHGTGEEHNHGGTAFSLWMDLELFSLQADAVYKALSSLLPGDKKNLEQRHKELLQDLDMMDSQFLSAGEEFRTRVILASHPVYQYFSRAYTGDIKSMLLEPDVYPSKDDWDQLVKLKQENKTGLMIWEGEPLPETQVRLNDLDITWVVISPGFNKNKEGDFLYILENNLIELKRLKDFIK